MVSLIRRLGGFSTLPFVSAILPFLAIPVVGRTSGEDGWTAFNVGQAVGAYAAAVGYVGWNSLGTPMVAAEATPSARHTLYARSFYARLPIVVVVAVIAAVVGALLSPASALGVAVTFAVAGALGGFGLSWYAVGVSSISLIVWFEIVPRAIATAVAIAVLLLTGDVVWYGVAMIVAAIAGVVAFHLVHLGRLLPVWDGWRQVRHDIASLRSAWGVEIVGNLYSNAPVPVAAASSSVAQSASYSSSDRIYRYGLLGVVAVGNALQGWTLEARGDHRRLRNRVSIALMSGLGLFGMCFLTFVGVPVSEFIFGGAAPAVQGMLIWLGLSYLAIAASTPLIRNVLLPARREATVLKVTIASAGLGLAGMIGGGVLIGPSGVAAGLALSEVFTLVCCIAFTRRVGLGEPATPQTKGDTR